MGNSLLYKEITDIVVPGKIQFKIIGKAYKKTLWSIKGKITH